MPKLLSDARAKHFDLGKGPKGKVAVAQFERAWGHLLEITGDIPLDHLSRDHANEFVQRLIKRGLSAETGKRYLAQVRPVIQTGLLEFEMSKVNPFEKLTIPNRDEGPRKPRDTFTIEELMAIQAACREKDDERRWLIAMLSDTMTRLAELQQIMKEDVRLNDPVPHVRLRVTEVRGLKTGLSARSVPLVGAALWAALRAMTTEGKFRFPEGFSTWTATIRRPPQRRGPRRKTFRKHAGTSKSSRRERQACVSNDDDRSARGNETGSQA
ncbi:hypothetical protein FBT96_12220 [Rhodobacter capsulatus]|uniref:Phage integrase family protein n=1 Tax=Rhodobacter capsulatus TaxID=1061 RepID=A0A4U1JR81_RHOCA|nr:hypothetical protein [Rhodobacter capsulatus]TKD17906.1 hypothetical protein FBT96_12220 [Rhodobacter capsulatus]